MKTDSLIEQLTQSVAPVRNGHVARVLALALLCGALVSVALMFFGFGLRPDLSDAMAGGPFWMKFAYTLVVAGIGVLIVERLARPGMGAGRQAALLALPFAVLLALAFMEWNIPGADHHHQLMGGSANVCVRNILLIALPIFIALFWGLRSLAPTRLALAGAGAGVLAGALGAWIYAFHCTESAAPFVALWYTLGIAGAGVAGAVIGRWALRW